jgi:hypothetical protein
VTEKTARTIANVGLSLAAAGVVYYIVRTPPLRRMAVGLAVTALTGLLPAWIGREFQQAWAGSGHRAAYGPSTVSRH